MKKLLRVIGLAVFYLLWPLFYLLLRRSTRTRVLMVCGDEIFLVKGWLGIDSWSLPGGGIHRGEMPKVSAVREINEETGVRLQPGELIELGTDVEKNQGLEFRYIAYGVQFSHKPQVKLSKIELREGAWFKLADIKKLRVQPAVLYALDHWPPKKNHATL